MANHLTEIFAPALETLKASKGNINPNDKATMNITDRAIVFISCMESWENSEDVHQLTFQARVVGEVRGLLFALKEIDQEKKLSV